MCHCKSLFLFHRVMWSGNLRVRSRSTPPAASPVVTVNKSSRYVCPLLNIYSKSQYNNTIKTDSLPRPHPSMGVCPVSCRWWQVSVCTTWRRTPPTCWRSGCGCCRACSGWRLPVLSSLSPTSGPAWRDCSSRYHDLKIRLQISSYNACIAEMLTWVTWFQIRFKSHIGL